MAQDFWDPVPASSWVLSGMGWLSPCRAHSKLQFVQLAILQMPLGHKMKTKERLFGKRIPKDRKVVHLLQNLP